jgi:hypothetical protein
MSVGTLAGLTIHRATLTIPRIGLATAEVHTTTADEVLEGTVTLALGSLELVMAIEAGDTYRQRGHYRLVAGRGGWRKTIPARAYNNPLEVKLSTVLRDAAVACGETIGPFVERRIGPGYVRPEGPASHALTTLVPEWYVDEAGVTQVGVRPLAPSDLEFTVLDDLPAQESRVLGVEPESLALVMPGLQLEDGWEVASVRHELTEDSLRTTVARRTAAGPTLGAAFARLHRLLSREQVYRGVHEFVVTAVVGGAYLDLRPRRAASKLPALANVPMVSGVPGVWGAPRVGSTVLVGFGDGLGTRPYVVGYDGPAADGKVPTSLTVDSSGGVTVGASATSITLSGTTIPVPSALGHFVRYGDIIAGPVAFGAPLTITQQVPGTPVAKARS